MIKSKLFYINLINLWIQNNDFTWVFSADMNIRNLSKSKRCSIMNSE